MFTEQLLDTLEQTLEHPNHVINQKLAILVTAKDQHKISEAIRILLVYFDRNVTNDKDIHKEKLLRLRKKYASYSSQRLLELYRRENKIVYAFILFARGLGSMLAEEAALEIYRLIMKTTLEYLARFE